MSCMWSFDAKNGSNVTRLRHLPFGDSYTVIEASRVRYRCTNCEHSEFIPIGFKTEGHLITVQLRHYTESLLAYGHTLKSVANITGLNKSRLFTNMKVMSQTNCTITVL